MVWAVDALYTDDDDLDTMATNLDFKSEFQALELFSLFCFTFFI